MRAYDNNKREGGGGARGGVRWILLLYMYVCNIHTHNNLSTCM